MDPVEFLRCSGGVAGPVLLQASGRRSVRTAIATGAIVRVGRGRYALPAVTASLGSRWQGVSATRPSSRTA